MSAAVAPDPDDVEPSEARNIAHRKYPKCTTVNWILLVVKLAAFVVSGYVLLTEGGAEDELDFFADFAALGLIGVSIAAVGGVLLYEACGRLITKNFPRPPLSFVVVHWLRILLEVNAIGLVVLALLAHGTLVLLQVCLTIGGTSWALCGCSALVWIWHWGCGDEGPPMTQILLRMRKDFLFVLSLFFYGCGAALLYSKSRKDLGLDDRVGRLEVFLLYSLGGSLISTVLVTLLLWIPHLVSHQFRRWGVLQLSGRTRVLTCYEALFRATVFSFLMHFIGSAFFFIALYGIIAAIIVLMTRHSLRLSRPSKGGSDLEEMDGTDSFATTATAKSTKSKATNATTKTKLNEGASLRTQGTTGTQKRLRKKRKEKSIKDHAKAVATYTFMITLGIVKVAFFFCVFIFDVVLVQRALSGGVRQNFMQVEVDQVCGNAQELLNDATDNVECAAVAAHEFQAFSYAADGQCFGYDKISKRRFTRDEYDDITRTLEQGDDWDCFQTPWRPKPSFEFYLLEPRRSCAIGGRRLQAHENRTGNSTRKDQRVEKYEVNQVYSSSSVLKIPEASEELTQSEGMHDLVKWIMNFMHTLVNLQVGIPKDIKIKCSGVRRLISAYALFGAVIAVGMIASLDIMSILAASSAVAEATAQEKANGDFKKYLWLTLQAQMMDKGALLVLQWAITTGVWLEQEAVGVWASHCGVLVGEDNLSGTACPVFWHAPVDAFASVLIYVCMITALCIVLAVFGGGFYGLEPARWAVPALFGRDIQLAGFTNESTGDASGDGGGNDAPVRQTSLPTTARPCGNSCLNWIFRPILGIPITLGIWTRMASQNFQIGRRQDWYTPVGSDDSDETSAETSELVPWKAMYQSTSKVISLAWLPFPYIGPLLSKNTQYLNEYVIFAFGKDGEEGEETAILGEVPYSDNWKSIFEKICKNALNKASRERITVRDCTKRDLGLTWSGSVPQLPLDPNKDEFPLQIASKEKSIIKHFERETPKIVQILHWSTYASQVLIIFAIQFDFFGISEDARMTVLSACIAIVIGIALCRVFLDLFQEFMIFKNTRGLLSFVEEIVEDGVPERVVEHALAQNRAQNDPDAKEVVVWRNEDDKDAPEEDPLQHLGAYYRAKVVKSCAELVELKWVRERKLKKDYRRLLTSANSFRKNAVKRLLKLLAANNDDVSEGLAAAAVLLLLHELAEKEIRECRASAQLIEKAPKEARTKAAELAPKLLELALTKAKQQAASEAAERIKTDAARGQGLRQARGTREKLPDEPLRYLNLKFTATSSCTAILKGSWKDTKREFGRGEFRSTAKVVASGEVEVRWDAGTKPEELTPEKVSSLDDPDKKHYEIIGDPDQDADYKTDEMQGRSGAQEEPDLVKKGREAGKIEEGATNEGIDGGEEKQTEHCGIEWIEHEMNTRSCQCCRGKKGSMKGGQAGDLEDKVEILSSFVWKEGQGDDGVPSAEWQPEVDMTWRRQSDGAILGGSGLDVEEEMQKLEQAIRESAVKPQAVSLAGAFLSGLRTDSTKLSREKASRRARLLAVASRMLRNKAQGNYSRKGARAETSASEVPKIEQERQANRKRTIEMKPLEHLRSVMAQDRIDLSDLSIALDRARAADVDPLFLARAEELFNNSITKQRIALTLVQAMENRMIGNLRKTIEDAEAQDMNHDEYPDEDGVGVLEKAKATLEKEEKSALDELRAAIDAKGALRLQRAIQQAEEAGVDDSDLLRRANVQLQCIAERKKRIAMLKMAMASNNVGLLKEAIEECLREGVGEVDSDKIDVRQATELLNTLEEATNKLHTAAEDRKRSEEDVAAALAEGARLGEARSSSGGEHNEAWGKQSNASAPGSNLANIGAAGSSGVLSQKDALKQIRANAALRAAIYQEPPEAGMLMLAIKQAQAAGCTGAELEKAQRLLAQEEDKEKVLGELKKGTAMNDINEMTHAIQRCHELGVDPRKLLTALTHLIEEHAKVARKAGHHGLSSVVIQDIEKERRRLHEKIQSAHGGLRTLCRIRPMAQEELTSLTGSAGLREHAHPAVIRNDRFSISVKDDKFNFGTVFGPECIQAEVFTELRGLVQSAVDGHNVLIICAGPKGSGKTHTLKGGANAETRGIVPRAIDELFSVRDRDDWRANLEVDVQMVDVVDAKHMVDVLGTTRSSTPDGIGGASVRLVPQTSLGGAAPRSVPTTSGAASAASSVVLDGAATRRVAGRSELRGLVEEAYNKIVSNDKTNNLLIFIHLTRTNRATGAMSRSRIVFADAVGLGNLAEANAAYDALEAVFVAIAQRQRKVPFREHVLTQALQDCMGGSAKTALLVNLPPGSMASTNVDILRSIRLASCGTW